MRPETTDIQLSQAPLIVSINKFNTIIQTNSARPRLQSFPAFIKVFPVFHNGKRTNSGVLSRLSCIRSSTVPDIQVRNIHSDHKRAPRINPFPLQCSQSPPNNPTFHSNHIPLPRILISHSLCITKHRIGTKLRFCIIPTLPYPIILRPIRWLFLSYHTESVPLSQ